MRGLLPSVWLLGAALYTALTLFLSRPAIEEWPLPPRINETVIAKQPPKSAGLVFKDDAKVALAASVPAAEARAERRNEWVQIAGYTTVGRVRPSSAAPVLFAYSVGRPLRVLARQDGFVKVQDLGSGQLGWVRENSLVPFTGGYRLRDERVAEPVVAAVEPDATVAKPEVAAVVTPVAVKRVPQPRTPTVAAEAPKEPVAVTEPEPRGLFRRRRSQVQHVALDNQGTGVAAIMQRALSRF